MTGRLGAPCVPQRKSQPPFPPFPVASLCVAGNDRRDVAHEAFHRLEQVVEGAIAVEIDLERVEAGGLAVAQQIVRYSRWSAVTGRPLLACRGAVAGDRAEFHPETHARGNR